MKVVKLEELPTDLLLTLCEHLRPEDCLSLIQTCKSLYNLCTLKIFWIQCATRLQRRRRVHRSPLEDLQIQELRSAILHTLKLHWKWSGRAGVDPGPKRLVELDTNAYRPPSVPVCAVTWAWFLDDGAHIICVVDDVHIQLWNLKQRRPALTFHAGGQLIRASRYSDHQCFLMAACVTTGGSVEGEDVEHHFKVWRYDWACSEEVNDLQPFVDLRIPMEGTFTFLSNQLAGLVYVLGEKQTHPSYAARRDGINFVLIDWRDPSAIFRCYTPLAMFGPEHALQCLEDTFRMTRSSRGIYMHFEGTRVIDTYSYDLGLLVNLLQTQGSAPESGLPASEVFPTSRTTYRYVSECDEGLPDTQWATWGDSCLWDGRRVGMLSQNVKFANHIRVCTVIALSVLDLDASGSIAIQGDQITPHYYAEFTRPIIYVRPPNMMLSVSPDYHVLVSQPSASKSVAWAVTSQTGEAQIEALVLAQFPPEHPDDDEVDSSGRYVASTQPLSGAASRGVGPTTDAQSGDTRGDDLVSIKTKGEVVNISLVDWLPPGEETADIDLDDVRGRVAFGMQSGKVVILEFV